MEFLYLQKEIPGHHCTSSTKIIWLYNLYNYTPLHLLTYTMRQIKTPVQHISSDNNYYIEVKNSKNECNNNIDGRTVKNNSQGERVYNHMTGTNPRKDKCVICDVSLYTI